MANKNIEWDLPTQEELVVGQEELGTNNLPIKKDADLDIKTNKELSSPNSLKWDLDIDPKTLATSPYQAARLGGEGTAYGPDFFEQFDFTPKIGGDNRRLRAERQEWYKQFGNFANQAVIGEIIGGTIEGVGYLLDIPMMASLAKNEEQQFGNWLSDVGKGLKTWTKDVSPIYELEPGKFRPLDSGWWFKNGVSVFSTLSLMIPAAGAVRGLSMLGKFTGVSSKLGKMAHNASKLARGRAISAESVEMSKWLGAGVSQAVFSRHAESLMESSQVFDQNYKRYLAEGFEEPKARELAAEGASLVYRKNWWMLLTDVPQYLMMGARFTPGRGKIAKTVNDAVDKGIVRVPTGMGTKARFITGMGLEGFEEAYQHVIAEEGTYLSDLKAGLTDESAFDDRMEEYLRDDHLWTASFFGAIGGGAFQYAMPKVQDWVKKYKGETTQDDIIDQKIKNIKGMLPALSAAAKRVKEADSSGDVARMHEARYQLNMLEAVKAAANGTTEQYLALLDHLENMSEEDINEWNQKNPDNTFDKQFLEELMPELKAETKEISEIFKAEKRQHGVETAIATTQELYKISKYGKDIEKYQAEIEEIEQKYIPEKEKLSEVGTELYDTAVEIKRLRHAQKMIEYLLKNNYVSPNSIQIYNEHLNEIRETIPKYVEKQKELNKRKRTKEEKKLDNEVLSLLDVLDPLNQKAAQVEMMKVAIDNAKYRLRMLRDTKKRKATVDQTIGERAWANNQVEEKLRKYDSGKDVPVGEVGVASEEAPSGAVSRARNGEKVGEGNDIVMVIAGKPIAGTLTYNVGQPDIEAGKIHVGLETKESGKKMKKAPIGYLFTSHDGKVIQAITGENVGDLHIISKKEMEAIASEQERRRKEQERLLAIQEVYKSLNTRIGELQKQIAEKREKIEQNRGE